MKSLLADLNIEASLHNVSESQNPSLVRPIVRVANDDVALDGDGHHGVHRSCEGDVDGGQEDGRLRKVFVSDPAITKTPESHLILSESFFLLYAPAVSSNKELDLPV